MEELLQEVLYPVLLGSNTACHATVRQLQKRFGVDCTVLTGKRTLTLRFMPGVRLIDAPATLTDDMLLQILTDVEADIQCAIPFLILCDPSYDGFVERNRTALEAHFVLRRAKDLGRMREE
ncbi:MAG: hypothetical protein E7585_01095 [Ruminococcaceae bacterium]|nr:hypothetical protein [Oscillospiraceae bacterium]